jgi:hypothetical protein
LYDKIPACEEDGQCSELPWLMPENGPAIFVWSMTNDQWRTAGMDGTPFAPDHNAIWTFMDKFEIENSKDTFMKVKTLFTHFLDKMREERKSG